MLIVSAAILPLALVAAFALIALLKGQQAQTAASTVSVARALATAIDGEMRLTISALQALGLTEPLSAADDEGLEQAHALMTELRRAHADWRAVLLLSPTGSILFNTEGPIGAANAVAVERASLEQVVRTQEPAVGPLARGRQGEFAFPVRVPVIRNAQVRYVLTAVVRPEQVAAVLTRQRVPDGWSGSVFDSNNARVARTTDDGRLRGTLPSESLLALMRQMDGHDEMVGETTTIEGTRVQTAVARLTATPWTVALGASVAAAELLRQRTLLAYGGGLIVSLGLGALAAWWMSRAITTSVARLGDHTIKLGRGEPVSARRSGIAEIDIVEDALAAASIERARIESDRRSLWLAESLARTSAENARQRLARLVDASTQLSASLEEATTLAAIADVVVPTVADLCRIDLLDDDGQLQRKLTHHANPERSAAITRMVASRGAAPNVPGSFPWAISTGKTYLHNIDDSDLPSIDDPQMREFVAAVGISAACVVPLVARGRTIGVMAVVQADSGRRFTQEDGILIGELAQRAALALDNVRLLADARHAQAQSEAANRSKDEFLAMLGHELRNPLAPISLALELIARKDANAFPRERQIIERQVKHLSRMVDDLLDVSRIVSGKIVLKTEDVDLRDVVKRALELTMPMLQTRDSMPEVHMPDAPVAVRGDPLRLAQVVSNLLNNAAKFTPAAGGISIVLRTEDALAKLSVVDAGAGVAPELQSRIFEPFVQGEQALHRASGGLGLGLAISQSLTGLHGGSLELFSAGVGEGSTFTLSLPLVDARPMALQHTEGPRISSRRFDLLLVDDNIDAVEALKEWLVLEGHRVRTALNAEDALQLLQAAPSDAGIFDIGLPGMSGHELAQRVRSDPRLAGMALVALTGFGRETDRIKALEAGFDDHFAKPPQVDRMLARLDALLADQAARGKT